MLEIAGVTACNAVASNCGLPDASATLETKQGEAANGVMAMRDRIVADFNKEMREAGVDEKDALGRT